LVLLLCDYSTMPSVTQTIKYKPKWLDNTKQWAGKHVNRSGCNLV
jgi:hypothetical protein